MNLTKLLHPKTCVRVLVADNDRRIRGYYKVPKGNQIIVGKGDNQKNFTISNESPILFSGKQPCFFFVSEKAGAIDPYSMTPDPRTPENIATIMKSKFLKDIALAGKGGANKQLMLIAGIVAIAVVVGFYFLYTQIQTLGVEVATLKDLLETALGVGNAG